MTGIMWSCPVGKINVYYNDIITQGGVIDSEVTA